MEEQIIAAIAKELERQGTGSVLINIEEQNAMRHLACFYSRTGQIEREKEIRILLVERYEGIYSAYATYAGIAALGRLAYLYECTGEVEKEERLRIKILKATLAH